MKIMMIPGERNEELILKVREATAPLHNEEGCEDSEYHECFEAIDNLIEEYGLVEMFDALYYACENRDEMLQDQTSYFNDLLYCDEVNYYIGRMTGTEPY